ncbi:apolipoprotein N-acyltransferase [Aestuariirhabdus litorea]|uniref:Apolipoprotein N-acyltransferase n=1 Tax=Aestuariirhabdus litorea TaxID=2528527 RepID=A0A3P3VNS7_9GAMM|nr:apolipoprotein N-acyltransferase [Aestuariirhabdus litorea]RRJ83578.1 apolipoprotein N-acyltransferase [Aestuariirhabdus litorea]RWW96799.1 apolipoprotein N-acyltransferase [Endozoicomonadaceae bacterium GTF-13]
MPRGSWQGGWRAQTLALASGALAVGGFSPLDLWPLPLLSSALLYLLLYPLSPRQALWRGTAYGLGLFGAGTSWVYVSIHQFGAASVPLASVLTLLFCLGMALLFIAPFAWCYARLRQHCAAQRIALLGFVVLWVLAEWSRSWLFTGFPWLLWGYALLDTPVSGWAPVSGVYGLSALLVAGGALLGEWIRQRTPSRVLIVGSLGWGALVGGGVLLGLHPWSQPSAPALKVALIQPAIPQQMKWNQAFLDNTLRRLEALTADHWDADLVVWPENAIPALQHRMQPYLEQLSSHARSTQTSLVTGIPIYRQLEGGQAAFYNGITSLGQGEGDYLKQQLVPFGEYVPLQSLLRGLIAFFDLPMSDFARGPADQPLLRAGAYQLAPLICYEVVYPDLVAGMGAKADLLLTISNDTWFGASIGPHQHLQMARMRALENGRYLIRATNDGVTAVVDPQGALLAELPQFEPGALRASVFPMTGNTPFSTTGSWPLLVLLLLSLLLSTPFRRGS